MNQASPKEFARIIPWAVPWSFGSPCPKVISNSDSCFLIYYTDHSENQLALVSFTRVKSFRFGIVNDEAIGGHPLYDYGLEVYAAHVVENSNWISELQEIHKVHPRYSDRHWDRSSHYLLVFHDEIFEIIADGYHVESISGSLEDLLLSTARKLIPS